MDKVKSSQREEYKGTLFFKSISLQATRGTLWPRSPTGPISELPITSIIPLFRLSNAFKQSMQRFYKDQVKYQSQLYSVVAAPALFSPREIDLLAISPTACSTSEELLIPLIHSASLEKDNYESILHKISRKVENFQEIEILEPHHLCVPLCQYQISGNLMKLVLHLVIPSISFIFQPITPLKLVSTPLCQSLTKKEPGEKPLQIGFLTLDQKKRVLPLKFTEKSILRYPLVGVWASGCKEELHKSSQIWAAFVRFIESASIKERISPNPSTGTFLFTYFSPKPQFYEISINGKSIWKVLNRQIKPNCCEINFNEDESYTNQRILREKKSLTASTSSSEGRYSRIRQSFESASTEKMILKQNLMLKNLEKQINELQYALSEPKLVNAETNTTSYFEEDQNNSARIGSRRLSTGIRDSVESFRSNPLRSSCNVEIHACRVDSTINMPKIIYKPDSDSDEEFSLELHQYT